MPEALQLSVIAGAGTLAGGRLIRTRPCRAPPHSPSIHAAEALSYRRQMPGNWDFRVEQAAANPQKVAADRDEAAKGE